MTLNGIKAESGSSKFQVTTHFLHSLWISVSSLHINVGLKPLLPDPDTSTLQSNQRGEQQARPYQQQQHQQIQAFYQQQQQIQQQTRSQPNNFPSKPFQSQGQMPSSVPQVPLPMRQQQQPQNAGYNQMHNLNRPHGMQNVNLAAQALVRQQLFNQAARARFIAQAQLLQQQPQVT